MSASVSSLDNTCLVPSATFGSEGSVEGEFPEYNLLLREDQIQLSQPVLCLLDFASEENTMNPFHATEETHAMPKSVGIPVDRPELVTEPAVSPTKSSALVPQLPAYDLLCNANVLLQQGILCYNEEKIKAETKQKDYELRLVILEKKLVDAEASKKKLVKEVTSLETKLNHLLTAIHKEKRSEEITIISGTGGKEIANNEKEDHHPWASLSNTALGRKTKAELTNFLTERVRK